jgi:hypothetical protein
MISGQHCNVFPETSVSDYQKTQNHFHKIVNVEKLTFSYIYEMIYESYVFYQKETKTRIVVVLENSASKKDLAVLFRLLFSYSVFGKTATNNPQSKSGS